MSALSSGERVERLLAERLAGSTLQPPRFGDTWFLRFELGGHLEPWYRWPIVDRIFDLPGPLSRRRRRIVQAVARATALYEELCSPADGGFVVAYLWPKDRSGQEPRLLELLPERARGDVERSEGVNYWDDPEGGDQFVRLVAPVAPRELDYRSLFLMIANADFRLEPSISGEIFILNETNPIIFKMYDDRGAIVYAPAAERLAALEAAHSDWLVPDETAAFRPQ
jgi:hypothetical protein